MIRDLREVAQLPVGECDVCIVGAGPAGIVLALELARARPDWKIVLAEAGGFDQPAPGENDSYDGETSETAYPLAASRLRYLGGTSNHWGGWCRPLDVEDFEPRSDIALSGWPFARTELDAHYRSASRWCEIGSDNYDVDALNPAPDGLLDLSGSELLCHRMFRFSPPTRFGSRYRDDVERQQNLELWLHASAVGLEFDNERVSAVRLAGPSSVTSLRARRVVLAMGGIENARSLLLNQDQAGGISGLSSPMLGRCFADHVGFSPARALLPARLGYQRQGHDSGALMPVLAIDPAVQREHKLPNLYIHPVPRATVTQIDGDYAHNPALGFREGDYWNYSLQMVLDPEPNPDSRITLSDERDVFGLRKIRLDWRITEADRARGERCVQAVASDLGALGLGRMRAGADEGFGRRQPAVVFHQMGTTRMAEHADIGVVDAHCRVHGSENLYVAGSSVFPTFGFSNPTLTIVALAVRMAAHLASMDTGGKA